MRPPEGRRQPPRAPLAADSSAPTSIGLDRLQPVDAKALLEDEAIRSDRVAHPDRVGRREPAGGIDGRVEVLAVVAVVKDDPVAIVRRLHGLRCRAGLDDVGWVEQAAAGGQDQLAKAAEAECLADRQHPG